jgi:ATP-dependent protease ClpP protease subunit
MATSKKPGSAKRRTMSQNDMLAYWTESGIFIPQRKLYLGSVTTDVEGSESYVDAAMAKQFEIGMSMLEYFDPKGLITVVMNNPGGDYYHGMAIYDRIKDSSCPVTIHASGYVMSMGCIILQAADKRLLSRNVAVMVHYGTDGFIGHSTDMQRVADQSKRVRATMEDIYIGQMTKKDPNITRAKVQEMLGFDTYLDAARAIRLGLADGLIPQTKNRKAKTTASPAESGESSEPT